MMQVRRRHLEFELEKEKHESVRHTIGEDSAHGVAGPHPLRIGSLQPGRERPAAPYTTCCVLWVQAPSSGIAGMHTRA